MKIIGRIANTLYVLNEQTNELSTNIIEKDNTDYSFDDYSDIYFIELAAFGKSDREPIQPITINDILANLFK